MRIAIVDDLQTDRETLRQRLTEYLDATSVPFELCEFCSAEDFLSIFVPKAFDLVFMDIYMGGISGIEAANTIFRQDLDCKLIFLTADPQHWKESFHVRAVYYLVKPICDDDFVRAMELAVVRKELDVPLLTVQYRKAPMTVDTAKILFVEYRDRQTYLHLLGETLTIDGGFAHATAPLLQDRRFLRNVRGMMVNMEYIERTDGEWFYLQNGQRLPVGIRHRRALVRSYSNYHLGTLRRDG